MNLVSPSFGLSVTQPTGKENTMSHLLGLCGSLRRDSFNLKLMREAALHTAAPSLRAIYACRFMTAT